MTVAEQPRLLVVDDEEAICEGCRRVLSRRDSRSTRRVTRVRASVEPRR